MNDQDTKTMRLGIVLGAIVLSWMFWCLVECSKIGSPKGYYNQGRADAILEIQKEAKK